ncbi:HK97 gp10 family phage protein [Listeria booriae]|uniref:HK97 gp10 family phage protein n=1 Tax=Listeria booriae TaxID=1552123 RepID=A0A841YPJ5_9LIST|nr:HK97-gp10 family putative phage morphogenesis protein [Listeria booriae]MBC1402140.1 HK97 gp10 family phage protein [Listeria booriae]MBC1617872.1 HK97 gp10 family phage protein [Listeria booriae]
MVDGLEELQRNITKLKLNNKKAAIRGVNRVSELVSDKLKSNTPYDADASDHLRDDVKTTGVTGATKGDISKDIGFGKKTGWRYHFPEFGTTKQAPQAFAQKTVNQSKSEALEIYKDELRKGNQL